MKSESTEFAKKPDWLQMTEWLRARARSRARAKAKAKASATATSNERENEISVASICPCTCMDFFVSTAHWLWHFSCLLNGNLSIRMWSGFICVLNSRILMDSIAFEYAYWTYIVRFEHAISSEHAYCGHYQFASCLKHLNQHIHTFWSNIFSSVCAHSVGYAIISVGWVKNKFYWINGWSNANANSNSTKSYLNLQRWSSEQFMTVKLFSHFQWKWK